MRKVLSICTGMGLMDLAFKHQGFEVLAGCEINPDQRQLHNRLVGGKYLCHDLKDLPAIVQGMHFDGVIGGPPCQSHTRLKSFRDPKYADATPHVRELLAGITFNWFVFENVLPVKVRGAAHVKLNAMHYGVPHQSRERWFAYYGLEAPEPLYEGSVDDLMAYPTVVGKTYGPIRAAKLQGYPPAADLKGTCAQLQLGLSNAVHYGLSAAWARQAWQSSV